MIARELNFLHKIKIMQSATGIIYPYTTSVKHYVNRNVKNKFQSQILFFHLLLTLFSFIE